MIDLNSLAIFAKIVEVNSLSEAARRLKMPVSTVSRRLAELEDQLGVRLLERSTRNLRLTHVGADILDAARKTLEAEEAIASIVSSELSEVSGLLRLSAPPSISDTLLAPLVGAFQTSYPNVRVQILIADRMVDHIAEGVDLAFRFGNLKDSALVARKLLRYRHQLVATPAYLRAAPLPENPQELLRYRLLTFSHWRPESHWTFSHASGDRTETITFRPHLAMNDFAGLLAALLADGGISDLPPIVQPELLRNGRLVEVMPEWHFPAMDLSLVHLGNRHMPRTLRVFKEFALQMVPTLFPDLPD